MPYSLTCVAQACKKLACSLKNGARKVLKTTRSANVVSMAATRNGAPAKCTGAAGAVPE